MPAAFLLQSWPTLHPLLLLFIGTLVSATATFVAARYWKRYDAEAASAKSRQDAENVWRQARLDAEQALRDEIKAERGERTKWQLENNADLERIAGILKDVNESQKITAQLAADSQHQHADLQRLNTRVEDISRQLTQFIMDHARH